jgi:homocysteine S-methyltransferase
MTTANIRNPVPPDKPTAFATKLRAGRFVMTVEVHPPRGYQIDKTLVSLRRLLERIHVDAFNTTDAPLAQSRMSAVAMSTLLQSSLGVEAILHVATRYRNLLALQSDLLGAHALGVRNAFVFMGDPPSMGDYPKASSISDITSSGFIRILKQANVGQEIGGHRLDQPTSFTLGCALNLESPDMDAELESLKRKVDAGADFILTQSVFASEPVERLHKRLGGFPLPLILGVLPLRSARHAEFLHNEVPGMVIPKSVRQRLHDTGDDALREGVTIAQELLNTVYPEIAGAYMVPAFGRYGAVADVVTGLPFVQKRAAQP